MKIQRKKIYDPFQRICHFGIAFFTLVLIASAYSADYFYEYGLMRKSLWICHVLAGFSLSFFFILRLIWGFVGPYHARFSSMWKYKDWKRMLREKKISVKWNWGHHPAASFCYLLFYFVIIFLCISGILLAGIEHKLGPFAQELYDQLKYRGELQDIHEVLSLMVIVFIAAHLAALFYHELKDQIPTIQSMFSGYQYKEGDNENEKDQ